MLRKIKMFIMRILGVDNLDRRAEREFRKMYKLYHNGGRFSRLRAKRIENQLKLKYGLCIYCSAKIGKDLQIRHPFGILIGRTAEVGDNCKVYPYFCAVAALKGDDVRFVAKVRRHPMIGNDCILGSKATVIGPITIGNDVTIGACAIVTKDVPSHSVVKGLNVVRPKRKEEIPEKYHAELGLV